MKVFANKTSQHSGLFSFAKWEFREWEFRILALDIDPHRAFFCSTFSKPHQNKNSFVTWWKVQDPKISRRLGENDLIYTSLNPPLNLSSIFGTIGALMIIQGSSQKKVSGRNEELLFL